MPKVQLIEIFDEENNVIGTFSGSEIFSGIFEKSGKKILGLMIQNGKIVVKK